MPVSLNTIVRDEEANFPACLASQTREALAALSKARLSAQDAAAA